MRLTNLEQKISEIISPVMKDMGIDLLWVEYKGGILGVFAENPNTDKLTLKECTDISREISPLLEVEDPIESAYRLEVSSAGIDRPLFNKADYEKYHDLEVKLESDELIEGQKKFRGRIREIEGDEVVIETDQGKYNINIASILKSKLVMTEELIKETKKRFEMANENGPDEVVTVNKEQLQTTTNQTTN